MKFTLVYDGDLPSSGNSPKPEAARDIRDKFHPQMAQLWKDHLALRKLRHEARVFPGPRKYGWAESYLEKYEGEPEPLRPNEIDLCAPIEERGRAFLPLVRESLGLACAVNILFLRQEHH